MPRTATRPMDEPTYDETPTVAERLRREAAMELSAEFERSHPAAGPRAPRKRHLTYWKMGETCPRRPCISNAHDLRRGYIVVGIGTLGPYGADQAVDFERAIHGVSLEREYGQWEQNNMAHGNEEVGLNWTDYDEKFPWGPFTELFKQGGVYEMPISQFFECGFHRDASLAKYRWNEIQELTLYTCRNCHPSDHKEFLEKAHLDNHNEAKHKELIGAAANASASAEAIGRVLLEHNNGGSQSESKIIQELLETQKKMMAEIEALKKGTN